MNHNIDVICQFSKNGTIIPIKFKVEENTEMQTFKIKRYKPPTVHLKTKESYHALARHVPNYLDYECIIDVFGIEKRIILRYILETHAWIVIY